jgi:hypothetical protein
MLINDDEIGLHTEIVQKNKITAYMDDDVDTDSDVLRNADY